MALAAPDRRLVALPHLLHRALLRGEGLLLALDGRLLVVLALADLGEDPRLLALLLEALHRILEGLAILHAHAGHSCLSSGFLSGAAGPKNANEPGARGARLLSRVNGGIIGKPLPRQGLPPPGAFPPPGS